MPNGELNPRMTAKRAPRPFGLWWRRQSPAQQDRFVTIGPLLAVLMFLGAIVLAFVTLRNEEIERETESVKRDAEIAQQQVRLRLIENQDLLTRMARDQLARDVSPARFQADVGVFASERAEVAHILWLGTDGRLRVKWSATTFHVEVNPLGETADPSLPVTGADTPPNRAFALARESRQAAYSGAFKDAGGTPVFQVYVPVLERGAFKGALVAEYSIEPLLRLLIPPDVSRRHAISVLDEHGVEVAGTVISLPGTQRRPAIVHDVPLAPNATGLVLRAQGWRTSIGLVGNTLFWMVVALSTLTVWMLIGTWRHVRRR